MKILYITKHNPWGKGGGAVASNMYLNAFLKIFAFDNIDLCISDQISEKCIPENIKNCEKIKIHRVKSRSKISKMVSPITGVSHRYQKIGEELLKKETYSYCIFDHSSIAGSLIKYVPNSTRVCVIHHNFEPDYFVSNCTNKTVRSLLLPSVLKNEETAYKNADINIFLTKEDRESFLEHYGKNKGKNIVTGLFEPDCAQITSPTCELNKNIPTLVISGSLNNIQNTDGIKYFINELYPQIPKNYKIIIAGRNPNEAIINLVAGKSNIELIPNPEDMSEVVRRGNIFMSPARSGSGIKVRITDGLKLGLPVIAHKVSARGYEEFIEQGYFKSFSSPSEFRIKLDELVKAIDCGDIKPENIVALYRDVCSIDSAVTKIKRAMDD